MVIPRVGINSKFTTWIHIGETVVAHCGIIENTSFLLVALEITNSKGIVSEVSFTNLTVMADKEAVDPSKHFFIFANNSSRFL